MGVRPANAHVPRSGAPLTQSALGWAPLRVLQTCRCCRDASGRACGPEACRAPSWCLRCEAGARGGQGRGKEGSIKPARALARAGPGWRNWWVGGWLLHMRCSKPPPRAGGCKHARGSSQGARPQSFHIEIIGRPVHDVHGRRARRHDPCPPCSHPRVRAASSHTTACNASAHAMRLERA